MKTEVKNDNELIAEFMGLIPNSYRPGDYSRPEDYLETSTGKFGYWEKPKYDTSWDWLMPVVEKIELIAYSRNCPIHWKEQFDGRISTDIQAAYDVVVEFIRWYNSQTTSNPEQS